MNNLVPRMDRTLARFCWCYLEMFKNAIEDSVDANIDSNILLAKNAIEATKYFATKYFAIIWCKCECVITIIYWGFYGRGIQI